nr:cation transporting ATPase C-terminal domain-containing protein [Candidatus Ozemobacteraceae bacterium]
HGRGVMRVTSVGDATKLGQAGAAAAAEREEPSPLRLQLDGIARTIAFFGITVSALVFTVLVAGRILGGSIAFTPAQAWAHACLGIGIASMTFPFWLPTALDVLGLLGFEVTGRDLFAEPPWRLGLRWGGICVGAGLFLGIAAGILPLVPAAWGSRSLEAALLQDFLQTLALIVVAVPDGLSMSITLCLAWGMRRLLAGRTLVRRLHACETIGAVTVICTGDSGRMLEPHLSVGNILQGSSLQSPETVPHRLLAEAMAVNATAHLARRREDPPVTIGDPLEGVLLFWLRDRGISYMGHRSGFELYRQWQAGPDTWFMATLGHPADKNSPNVWRLHVKAKGDMLLKRCQNALVDGNIVSLEADSPVRAVLEKHLESLSPCGRTVGFAMREGTGAYPDNPSADLTWLGAVLIAGSISPETAAAFDQCRRAGIRVTLVSSDSPESAVRVAREAGLSGAGADGGSILTGEAMHRLDGMHAAHAAGRLAVLARANGADRTKLIDLLRQRGEVVAAVGVHDADAASLRRADIGLVMGNGASERIRSAGDLILPDEGLPALLSAVKWGRALFLNIQRFLVFQLSVNLMALGINLLGPFIGVRLPLTILQMLWVNIIMDIFAALALATEPPHTGILDAPPRKSRDFIVTGSMIQAILTTSALSMSVFLLALRHWQSPDGSIDARHLTWFFCLFVLVQLWNLVNARGFGARRPPWLGLGENRWFGMMLLAILLTQAAIVQWGGAMFRTVPLSLTEWVALIAGTSPLLIVGRSLGYPDQLRRTG